MFLAATQFVGSAQAEESTGETTRDTEIIQRYDTNKDGKLDEAEIAAVKEQTLAVNQEKREANRERLADRKESLLKEFDKDEDGKLDDAEKQTMATTLRARIEKRPRMLKRLDTDGDGRLSDAEWIAGRDKVIERLQK
jgi:Ca2+-binding EF-hand superfamily protein